MRPLGGPVGQLRGGHEPVRRLPPAPTPEVRPAPRVELRGELGVRPDGGGDAVLQRGVAVEPRGGRPVQRVPPGGGQVGVHGRADELVGEGDVVAGGAEHLDEHARADGLVQAAERVGHRRERDGVGERGPGAEHRRGQHEALPGRPELGHAHQHERRERPGRGQDPGCVGELSG